jgi:hypothetical protein
VLPDKHWQQLRTLGFQHKEEVDVKGVPTRDEERELLVYEQ